VRAAGLWHVREARTESIARLGVVRKYDVTLPSAELARFAEEVPAAVAAVDPSSSVWLFGHVGDGNPHVNVTGAAVDPSGEDPVGDAVRSLVVAAGGSVSAEHGIGTAKRACSEDLSSIRDASGHRSTCDFARPDTAVLSPDVSDFAAPDTGLCMT